MNPCFVDGQLFRSESDAADAAALWDYTCAMESHAHQLTSLPGMFTGRAK